MRGDEEEEERIGADEGTGSGTGGSPVLTKSFAGAEAIAQKCPKYGDQITAAVKASVLSGQQWAYIAGIVVVGLGAALVFVASPRKEDERRLLTEYQRRETSSDASGVA